MRISIVIITVAVCMTSCMRAEMRRIAALPVGDVSIASIPDGSYTGSYTSKGFTYSVRAKVSEGRLNKVQVLQNRKSSRAQRAEVVMRRVVDKQSLDVELMEGLEGESKALLKALEKALSKGESRASE
ncbi:MAG: hypothetical protein GF418_03355 [Chitinivibrionales bacterium]|nr:hypothetical protein [Chitinivibrionales bacterium]MBD3394640.1 hypothetical protein [Chitinivibrionales bacterium]